MSARLRHTGCIGDGCPICPKLEQPGYEAARRHLTQPAAPAKKCIHFGARIGTTTCEEGCIKPLMKDGKQVGTRKARIPLFACAVHGSCTTDKIGERAEGCCAKCRQRQTFVPPGPFDPAPIRDLAYHIYPIKGIGVWEWNVRELLKRIDLFNGRRVVALAVDDKTDAPEAVMEAFRGHVDRRDFLVVQNEPQLREVATFEPLFSRVASLDPRRALLYAHAKGVTHPGQDVIRWWTEALYETMLDYWPVIEERLQAYPLCGAFRWKTEQWKESAAKWFYSGSWVWYRSKELFSRDWRKIERFWTGIEPYPAIQFSYEESACHVGEEAGTLYEPKTWERIGPQLREFAAVNAGRRTKC